MRKYLLPLLALLTVGALLAACAPSTVTVQNAPSVRSVTVTGSGMVTLTPDIAYVSIGVQTQDASAATAVSQNNAQAQAVMNAIKGFGVADKDIQTTNFSIYPQQQYDNNGKITGIVYQVNNTVYITVRDLTRLGDLLDGAVQAGANDISSISFDVADKTQALSQARKAAVANARAQADELTAATGTQVGEVQSISYADSTAPVVLNFAKSADALSAASVPVSSGSMQITTTVTIVYALK